MQLCSCGSAISSKVNEASHWWRERDLKNNQQHQQPQSCKTSKQRCLESSLSWTFSLACAFGILVLVVPEQKKGNLKLLLKYILRQFNPEDAEGSDDGGSSWYTKLHDHLE